MNARRLSWLTLFGLLTIGGSAMFALTRAGCQLDRRWLAAQAEARQQQRVSLALWRMDSWLAPLVTREAARPVEAYLAVPTSNPPLAPLAGEPPEYVRFYFHWPLSGPPQTPQFQAISRDAPPLRAGAENPDLTRLAQMVTCEALIDSLPAPTQTWAVDAMADLKKHMEVDASPRVYRGNAMAISIDTFTNEPQGTGPPNGGELPANSAAKAGGKGAAEQEEFERRYLPYETQAEQQYVQQRAIWQLANSGVAVELGSLVEGVSQPLWIGDALLLARRVEVHGEPAVQGCQFDWEKIRASLIQEVADLLPDAELAPMHPEDPLVPSRMLAGLPVRLVVGPPPLEDTSWSPMRWALAGGWLALAVTAVTAALLVGGTASLSEKRASFVSAVTHELRTPLTTFRMYSQMLHQGMVNKADQAEYLGTLDRESKRLCHLIDNVLTYSRLERGREVATWEETEVGTLLARIRPRLAQRAKEANMTLAWEVPGQAAAMRLTTDPGLIEQILFNLVDNAAKYAWEAEDRRIHLATRRTEDKRGDAWVELEVTDHGPGLSAEAQQMLFQPFSKSAQQAAASRPGVGLGLALARRLARQLRGELRIENVRSEGQSGCRAVLRLPG